MLPPNIKPEWSSDDCLALRTFLESDSGQRMLNNLSEAAPALLDGSDKVEKTLVRSGQVKGFSDAVNALIGLTIEQPPQSAPEKSAYPDLDNDSEWQDTPNP